MKKVTVLLASLLLLFGMSATAFADEVTISTTVPERHTVSIQAEGGQIIADHRTCGASIQVVRQSAQTYWIVPDAGKVLSALYYNGKNVTAQVRAGMFTAPVLTDDAVLEAVFADAPSSSGDERYDVNGTITGPDGRPISGAVVDIGGQTGTSDASGNFIVENVPAGTWTVTVTDSEGNVIGIGEITMEEPDSGSMSVVTDSNGNPVISPGSGTATISLTLYIGSDGVISIGDVKDGTPVWTEPEKPDGQTPGWQASDGQTPGETSPKTGTVGDAVFWGALMLASAAGLVGIVLCRQKKKYR